MNGSDATATNSATPLIHIGPFFSDQVPIMSVLAVNWIHEWVSEGLTDYWSYWRSGAHWFPTTMSWSGVHGNVIRKSSTNPMLYYQSFLSRICIELPDSFRTVLCDTACCLLARSIEDTKLIFNPLKVNTAFCKDMPQGSYLDDMLNIDINQIANYLGGLGVVLMVWQQS